MNNMKFMSEMEDKSLYYSKIQNFSIKSNCRHALDTQNIYIKPKSSYEYCIYV